MVCLGSQIFGCLCGSLRQVWCGFCFLVTYKLMWFLFFLSLFSLSSIVCVFVYSFVLKMCGSLSLMWFVCLFFSESLFCFYFYFAIVRKPMQV